MKNQEEDKLLQSPNTTLTVYLKPPSDQQTVYTLTHTADAISIKSQNNHRIIQFKDIIGVKVHHLIDSTYKIKINSFPFRKKIFRNQARTLQSTQFWVEGSKPDIERWHIEVLKRITNREIKSKEQLKFIAYFNPVAGSNSKAQMKRAQEFISHSNFELQIVETTGRNFCRQHIKGINHKEYQGVLIVSGDGLIHQFVNSQCCGKIPVCHIPAGSGNAFAKNQTTQAKEQCNSEVAAFLAIKGKTKPFNIFKVQLQKIAQPVYSFLSVEWALLSDIDINSQFLRFCGGLRFEIYTAWRLVAMRRYPGKLYYSFEDKQLPGINQPITNQAFHLVEGQFLNALFTTVSFISDKYEFSPLLKVQDKAIDMQFLTTHHGRWNLIKYMLNAMDGSHFDREKGGLKEGAELGWGKIKSYRLQPLGEGDLKGVLAIDGEEFEPQRIQVSRADRQLLAFV